MNPTCMDYQGDGSGLKRGKDQSQQLRKRGLGKEGWGKFLSPGIYHPLLRQNQKFRVPHLTFSLLSKECLCKALAKLLWAHTDTAAGSSNFFISLKWHISAALMIPSLLLTYANINMNPWDENSFEKQNTK